MKSKQDILHAIRQTTNDNGGAPLGIIRFEKETGITSNDWGKYWPKFSDAQKEAGVDSNHIQVAYNEEFLYGKLIMLARKLGRFPTFGEIRVEKTNDSEFPDKTVFQRRGTKVQLANKLTEYCKNHGNCEDIIKMCEPILSSPSEVMIEEESKSVYGEVYLFKSGRYYKIGKTNDTVRRGSELRIQLPEKLDLIHSIKTDDPSGVEAYWHRRFDSKRMQGEWFDLSSADIKAFKRWKRIV